MPPHARTRVLIIGGGPAALATAFELTAEDRAPDYEVTILQPGWRLGGKCASGRNAGRGERIEEHGLHVWFGCYDNAFALLDRCYGELQRSPDTHAFVSRDQAFEGVDLSVLWQRRAEVWSPQLLTFPRHRTPPPNFLAFATEAVAWLGHRLVALHQELEADDEVELDFTSALDQAGDELAVFDLAASYAAGVGGTLARVTSHLYRKVAEHSVRHRPARGQLERAHVFPRRVSAAGRSHAA